MARDDDSEDCEPGLLSFDRAALEQKRAAIFDELETIPAEKVAKGLNNDKRNRAKREPGTGLESHRESETVHTRKIKNAGRNPQGDGRS